MSDTASRGEDAFRGPLQARVLRRAFRSCQAIRGVPRLLYWLRGPAFGRDIASVRTPDGLPVTLDVTDYGQLMLFYFPYCRSLQALIRDLLRPGDVCIDLGANVGLLSVVMSQAVGPTGTVLSVDPNSRIADQLRMTASLAGISNIDVCNAGMAAKSGRGLLVRPAGAYSESFETSVATPKRTVENGDQELNEPSVRLESIDALVAMLGARGSVSFLKVDVEGEEAWLLESMRETFRRGERPRLLIEFHSEKCRRRGVDVRKIRDGLMAVGYDERIVREADSDYFLVEAKSEELDKSGARAPNVLYLMPEHISLAPALMGKWHG